MTFNVEAAKKSGYSDQEITDFLGKQKPVSPPKFNLDAARKSGYTQKEINEFLTSRGEKTYPHGVASFATEHPKEAATGAALTLLEPIEQIAGLMSPGGIASSVIQGKVPTPLSEKAREASGINALSPQAKEEASVLNFVSSLLPVERALNIGGKAAKSAQSAARTVEEAKGPSQAAKNFAERKAIMEATEFPKESTLVNETFPSGLTKPRAVEAANPELATITKQKRRKVLEGLENEAKTLFRSKIEEHLPLSKKIKEGFDFGKYYKDQFDFLKKPLEEFNPHIDITPLRELFYNTRKKYHGIPSPHPDATAITKEINAYLKRVPSDLKNLLKIRRSNSQKLNGIYDRRVLEGKRHEYVDFLNEMNRQIDESIGKTLPPDSSWFKRYKDLNKEYGEYRSSQKVLDKMNPLLGDEMKSPAISKLATDPKFQKGLRLNMGEKGANEVIQIAKDLRKAREAIKKMTRKEKSAFDTVWPLTFVFKPAAILAILKRGKDIARKGYGHYLSTPAKREAVDSALKSISSGNIDDYKKATTVLKE